MSSAAMLHGSDRIRALRELRGWTQTDFSQITGFSQNMISAFEKGQRNLSLAHIQRIAEATGTPDTFFSLPATELPLSDLHFRMKKTARLTATRTVVRKFCESHSLARRLSRSYTPRTQITFLQGPLDLDAMEDIAVDLRRQLGFNDVDPISHITRSCERAGIPVTSFAGVPGADSHHDGLSYTSDEGFASIACLSGQPGDRLRTTVGHELAHRVLHSRRDVLGDRREKEAFRLAAALFLPRSAALQELSESLTLTGYMRLKGRWGVSISSLIMRAADLSIIDHERKTSLMKQISRRGWRQVEPGEVEVERPALLSHLLTERFGPDPYRIAERELGYARSDLLEWIPPVQDPKGSSASITELKSRLRR
jgi:Zn-dependent peptidase ImmA (M78 family)/transcriptional regulator with XRE-family HTH domain